MPDIHMLASFAEKRKICSPCSSSWGFKSNNIFAINLHSCESPQDPRTDDIVQVWVRKERGVSVWDNKPCLPVKLFCARTRLTVGEARELTGTFICHAKWKSHMQHGARRPTQIASWVPKFPHTYFTQRTWGVNRCAQFSRVHSHNHITCMVSIWVGLQSTIDDFAHLDYSYIKYGESSPRQSKVACLLNSARTPSSLKLCRANMIEHWNMMILIPKSPLLSLMASSVGGNNRTPITRPLPAK